MKLNPKKCTFGAEERAFLGYVVNMQEIKACPQKVEAVMKLQSLQMLKEAQSLNGKLASLNKFLSKSMEKLPPFFKTLKRCVNKRDFQWTPEAKEAFKNTKKCIAKLPMVTTPKPREALIMYLCAAREAINAVLLTKKDSRQISIYFVSRALQAPEINYTSVEKVVLALVHATRRLRRPRTSISGQVLVDFIAERSDEGGPLTKVQIEETVLEPWVLFTDGSSCLEGSGAGLILTKLEGKEFTYALRFEFDASNNKAKYEALVASLRIVEQMGIKNLITKVDSRLIANQINGLCIEQNHVNKLHPPHQASPGRNTKKNVNRRKEILAIVEEEEYCWMTSLVEYLTKGILPAKTKKGTCNQDQGEAIHHDQRSLIQKVIHGTMVTPFYKWRINISGPFLEGQGKVKFLIVAIDYFTKWIEANPVAMITRRQVKKYIWDNIVCRFRLPGEIISDNGKQFRDNPFKDWCEKLNIKQRDTLFSLTYGTEAVIPVEIGIPSIRYAEVNQAENDKGLLLNLDILEEKREKAAVREARSKAKMEKYYNAKVRPPQLGGGASTLQPPTGFVPDYKIASLCTEKQLDMGLAEGSKGDAKEALVAASGGKLFSVLANADDEALTASRYEELLKKAGLEIAFVVEVMDMLVHNICLDWEHFFCFM
nr:hypothetical protein [Tanacetum cinerariifolium]